MEKYSRPNFDRFILNRVTPHPSYNRGNHDNDAALLKLQRRVDYGILPNVYPACWPSQMPQKRGNRNGFWVWSNVTGRRYLSYFERGQFGDLVQPNLSSGTLDWLVSHQNHGQHAVCREFVWRNGFLSGRLWRPFSDQGKWTL